MNELGFLYMKFMLLAMMKGMGTFCLVFVMESCTRQISSGKSPCRDCAMSENLQTPYLSNISACIEVLQRSLGQERVITSHIPQPYELGFSSITPGAMVFAESASDVSLVLNTALSCNVTVAVRSSVGHSYIGQSTMDGSGIVLNLAHMKNFRVQSIPGHDGSFQATLGPGLNNIQVYSFLAMNDPPLGIASGTCPSVGISGLISGGGEGMTSTFGGVTSDSVISAKAVVFINGTFQETNAPDDLLFALRGGMGGNYGVVTEWTVEVFLGTKVVVYSMKTRILDLIADKSAITRAIKAHADWLRKPMIGPSSPLGEAQGTVWGMSKFKSGFDMQFEGQCRCPENDDSCANCVQAINYLQIQIGGCEGSSIFDHCDAEIQDHIQAMWSWAGCTDFGGIDAYPGIGPSTPQTVVSDAITKCLDYDWSATRKYGKNKSLYLPVNIDGNFEEIVMSLVSDPRCNDGNSFCFIQKSFVGGKMAQEHSNSAFVHRTPGWHLQMIIQWTNNATDSGQYFEWAKVARQRMLPLSINEGYQNYPDSDLPLEVWSLEYFPKAGVFEKLKLIRDKYNPTKVLNVPWAVPLMIP